MRTSWKWVLCCGMCALAQATFGQAGYGTPSSSRSSSTETNQASSSREESMQFYRVKDLSGANVKDSQGQKLGEIDEILVNPKNGEAFAAIGVGHSRDAVVPLQALNVAPAHGVFHRVDVTLNAGRETLQGGPTVKSGEWGSLDDPGFTQSVYSHYKVQAPAMGGSGAGSMGGESSGAGAGQNPNR